MRSYDGLGMQLVCPTVHKAVRSYFDDMHPVVLTMMTTGVSQS